MTEIVLHIGTPKTGTTSIQHALSTNEDLLADKNITFIKTGRHRASHNDLANAISRHGPDHKFRDAFEEEFQNSGRLKDSRTLLMSSEIFSLIAPTKFRKALPLLDGISMKIVVYLRRQDQYAEAFYKQRLKNGRIILPFDEFLQSRVCRRITHYNALLRNWSQAYPKAEILPRIYDRANFENGDIVADFATILGLGAADLGDAKIEHNLSPSKEVVDILLALSPHFKGGELREIFQTVKTHQLDGFSGKGDLFSADERQAYFAQFSQENETLRHDYFADMPVLFHAPDETATNKTDDNASLHRPALLKAMLNVAFALKHKQK